MLLGHHFTGALVYAGDVILFAPSASGLKVMLHACEDFASSNGLFFNPLKSQLIRFSLFKFRSCDSNFIFCDQALLLVHSASVTHLGIKFMHNLFDDDDVLF